MKILYLVHQFYPNAGWGTEKFVLQLAQRMQMAGHTVKVITYDLQPPRPSVAPTRLRYLALGAPFIRKLTQKLSTGLRLFTRTIRKRIFGNIVSREYTYDGIPVIALRQRTPPPFATQRMDDPTLTAFARTLLQREQPDLLHVGHAMRVAEFVQVASALGIPYLLCLTDYWLLCPPYTLLNDRGELCDGPRGGAVCRRACPSIDRTLLAQRLSQAQRLLLGAAQVVAPSQSLAQKMQAEFGDIAIRIIPYGMDQQHLAANTRHYPTGEPLTFFYAGHLKEHKGIHLLLAAFQRLPAQQIRLQVYGRGPLEQAVRQQMQSDRRISFGGLYTNTQLGKLLSQVDVVVVPSTWHENLPLIMQEAQTCGVPTLVADVGGMTECVTDGVNGFTFRVGDVADLQAKMQMIIDQPEILNEIKENIRNPKPGQYRVTSLEEEAKLYLEQYERIVRKSP